MISIEFAVVIAIVLFMAGSSVAIYHNRMTKAAIAALVWSVITMGWVLLAANLGVRPVVDVTYHEVVKKRLSDGSYMDIIVIQDAYGRPHIININRQLGISVPLDQMYQVARVEYARRCWGLQLRSLHNYKVVPNN